MFSETSVLTRPTRCITPEDIRHVTSVKTSLKTAFFDNFIDHRLLII
jgi:hypothetical protein